MVRREAGEDVVGVDANSGVVDEDDAQVGIRRAQVAVDKDSCLVAVLAACMAPSDETGGEQEDMCTSQTSCYGCSQPGRGIAGRAAFCRGNQGDLVAAERLR